MLQVKMQVPLIVRLEGTNVERGKQILAESDVDIIPADDLDQAAKKAVESIQGGGPGGVMKEGNIEEAEVPQTS